MSEIEVPLLTPDVYKHEGKWIWECFDWSHSNVEGAAGSWRATFDQAVEHSRTAHGDRIKNIQLGLDVAARRCEPAVCRVCGKPGKRLCWTEDGPLTRDQWDKHARDLYDESCEHGSDKGNAWAWAENRMAERFGPRPEEQP